MRAAVLGLGTMGSSITRLLLAHSIDVTAADADPNTTKSRLAALGPNGPGSATAATDAVDAARQADVIFEVLPEDLDIKVAALAPVVAAAPDTPVFTNTSSIPVDLLASRLYTDRLIGVHFFNPADIMPGVEVIPPDDNRTSPTVEFALHLLERLGKTPTLVRSTPGFIANRLQLALFAEAARCAEEGLASPADIDTIVRTTFGLRLAAFGPFAIADMAGLDVFLAIQQRLASALGDHFEPTATLANLVESKRLGTKTGRGWFDDRAGLFTDAAARQRDQLYQRILHAVSESTQSEAAS